MTGDKVAASAVRVWARPTVTFSAEVKSITALGQQKNYTAQ